MSQSISSATVGRYKLAKKVGPFLPNQKYHHTNDNSCGLTHSMYSLFSIEIHQKWKICTFVQNYYKRKHKTDKVGPFLRDIHIL